MNWMLMPLKRYADFRGRARRMEYWMWVLFQLVMIIILTTLDNVLGLGGHSALTSTLPGFPGGAQFGAGAFASGGILVGIWSLAMLIPNIAVGVRRLHDIDRTGWWIALPILPYIAGFVLMFVGIAGQNFALVGAAGLIMLVGFVLAIVVLVFYCLPGTRGSNRFGPDPLDPNATEDLSEVFG